MGQNTHITKKRWTNNEIIQLKSLKSKGLKLKEIAKTFSVTANAVRKTLSRYIPSYIKIKKYKPTNTLGLRCTIDQLLIFGLHRNIITRDKNGFFYINNQLKTKFQCIDYINQYRIKNNLHKMLLLL